MRAADLLLLHLTPAAQCLRAFTRSPALPPPYLNKLNSDNNVNNKAAFIRSSPLLQLR